MISKAEAGVLRQSYINQMPARIEAALRAAAASGASSIVFNYSPAAPATADAFIVSTMTPAGWTCVNDGVSTLTIS